MKTMLSRTLALLCVVLMMVSLFALPAFAEEDHTGHDHATENNNLVQIIPWAALGGVVVIGVAVLLIKCPEKIAKRTADTAKAGEAVIGTKEMGDAIVSNL